MGLIEPIVRSSRSGSNHVISLFHLRDRTEVDRTGHIGPSRGQPGLNGEHSATSDDSGGPASCL